MSSAKRTSSATVSALPDEDYLGTSTLPDGWSEATIANVSDGMKNGLYKPANFYAVDDEDGIACLRMYNIHAGKIVWKNIKRMKLTPNEVGEYELLPGDLLVNRVNSRELVGKTAVFPPNTETCVFESKNIRLRLRKDAIVPELVSYMLLLRGQHYFSRNSQQVVGMASISQPQLGAFNILLPPYDEQRRIVEKVEQLLPRVDAARESLDRIPIILKRFRQAVLAAACSGRLTADWRTRAADTKNIAAIIATIRERRESQANSPRGKERITQIYEQLEEGDSSELPEGWAFVRLNKLCSSFDYGTSAKSHPSGKVPVLRMGNIQDGKIDWADLVFTSDKDEIHQYELSPQTLLFNRTNSPELVGKTAIYLGERPAIFAGYLIKINHLPEIDPRYLNFCLNTNYARNFCSRVKTDAVSQSNINAQKLGTFEVPFCPLAEQQEIVRRVEALFKFADAIENRVAVATVRAEKLTQAILARAFRGELVPTEAELARRERRSYESASALLDRIRASQLASTSSSAPANGARRGRRKRA